MSVEAAAVFPALLYLGLAVGLTIVAVRLWRQHSSHPGTIFAEGCALLLWFPGMFIVGFMSQWTHVGDPERFEQVFGFATKADEADLMFDDYGDIRDSQVFMRLYVYPKTEPTVRKLLVLPHIRKSNLQVARFYAMGKNVGLTWWDNWECTGDPIYEIDRFRQWHKVYLLDCQGAIYGIFLR
jgi:hypothetical protein